MHVNPSAWEVEVEGPEGQAYQLQSKFKVVLNETFFREKV